MSFSFKCGGEYFLSSDALYIVQCERIVFPLFGSCLIPVVLPDFFFPFLGAGGALVAQLVKRWPTDLAVMNSSPA